MKLARMGDKGGPEKEVSTEEEEEEELVIIGVKPRNLNRLILAPRRRRTDSTELLSQITLEEQAPHPPAPPPRPRLVPKRNLPLGRMKPTSSPLCSSTTASASSSSPNANSTNGFTILLSRRSSTETPKTYPGPSRRQQIQQQRPQPERILPNDENENIEVIDLIDDDDDNNGNGNGSAEGGDPGLDPVTEYDDKSSPIIRVDAVEEEELDPPSEDPLGDVDAVIEDEANFDPTSMTITYANGVHVVIPAEMLQMLKDINSPLLKQPIAIQQVQARKEAKIGMVPVPDQEDDIVQEVHDEVSSTEDIYFLDHLSETDALVPAKSNVQSNSASKEVCADRSDSSVPTRSSNNETGEDEDSDAESIIFVDEINHMIPIPMPLPNNSSDPDSQEEDSEINIMENKTKTRVKPKTSNPRKKENARRQKVGVSRKVAESLNFTLSAGPSSPKPPPPPPTANHKSKVGPTPSSSTDKKDKMKRRRSRAEAKREERLSEKKKEVKLDRARALASDIPYTFFEHKVLDERTTREPLKCGGEIVNQTIRVRIYFCIVCRRYNFRSRKEIEDHFVHVHHMPLTFQVQHQSWKDRTPEEYKKLVRDQIDVDKYEAMMGLETMPGRVFPLPSDCDSSDEEEFVKDSPKVVEKDEENSDVASVYSSSSEDEASTSNDEEEEEDEEAEDEEDQEDQSQTDGDNNGDPEYYESDSADSDDEENDEDYRPRPLGRRSRRKSLKRIVKKWDKTYKRRIRTLSIPELMKLAEENGKTLRIKLTRCDNFLRDPN